MYNHLQNNLTFVGYFTSFDILFPLDHTLIPSSATELFTLISHRFISLDNFKVVIP